MDSCRWSSHSRFKATGCQRQLGEGIRCGHPLLDPSLSNFSLNIVDLRVLPSSGIYETTSSKNSTFSTSTNYDTLIMTTEELIDIALQAIDKPKLEHQYLPLLEVCVNSLLDQVVSLSIHIYYCTCP